ncbi:hypothetical protein GQ600_25520 [Phytophthora cactorum]|nr:hypothetical protein GQ600_25520 [Phytophthora cactorum]
MRLMQMTLLNEGPADVEGELSVEALTDTPVPLRPYHGTRYQHATRRSKLMSSEVLKKIAARNLKSVVNTAANSQKQVAVVLPSFTTSTASSGLKLGSDDRAASVATIGVQLNTGARDESEETAGVSQLSPRWPSAPRRAAPDDSTNAKGRSTYVKRCAIMTPTGR